MKEALKDAFNVALYNGDQKDVEIKDSGKIHDKKDENNIIDIIISTSTIQSGQSLTDNILQIFIIINKPLNKLFNGLKKLYKYYGFKSCPAGYSITMNKLTIKGKRTRCYKLIKDDKR